VAADDTLPRIRDAGQTGEGRMSTIVFRTKKMTTRPNACAQSADMGSELVARSNVRNAAAAFVALPAHESIYNVTERSTSEASVCRSSLCQISLIETRTETARRDCCLASIARMSNRVTVQRRHRKPGRARQVSAADAAKSDEAAEDKAMISPATSRASMRTRTCWSSRC
jgi:hypothetical protein